MISWSNILILFSFISFNLAFNTTSQPSYFPHPHQIHSKFRRQSTSPSRPIHSVIKKRDLNGMGLQSILAINVPSPTPTSQSNSNLAAAKFTTQKEINHAKAGDGLELVSSQSIVPLGVQGAQTGLQTDFGNFFSTLPTQLKSSDSRFTTRSKLATVPLHSGTPPGAQTTTAATLSLSPARSTSTQMAPTQTPFISLTSPSISIPTAVPTSIATLFDSASIGSTFSNSAVAIASISAANVAKAVAAEFVLPGQELSVLPIGLGIVVGLLLVGILIFAFVNYERMKYRNQFRERQKVAEMVQREGGFTDVPVH